MSSDCIDIHSSSSSTGSVSSTSPMVTYLVEWDNTRFHKGSVTLTNLIYDLSEVGGFAKTPKSKIKCIFIIQVLLSNLFQKNDWLSVNLRSPLVKNGKNKISRKYLRMILKSLEEKGYIEIKSSFYSSDKSVKNTFTKIRKTDQLANLFAEHVDWYKKEYVLTQSEIKTEVVVSKKVRVKNEDKKKPSDKKYKYEKVISNEIKSEEGLWRKGVMIEYGKNMSGVFVWSPRRFFNDLSFKCVFNNNEKQGGRVYNNIYQLKKEERKAIKFNDMPSVELDFSSLHIMLLYNKVGMIPPIGDLYEVPGEDRDYCKKAMLVLINAKNENEAINSISQGDYNEAKKDYDPNRNMTKYSADSRLRAKSVLEKLKAKHKYISKYFCSNVSLDLMYEDSKLLFECMEELNELGIPYLTVHDSIVVPEDRRDETYEIMDRAIKSTLRIKPTQILVK